MKATKKLLKARDQSFGNDSKWSLAARMPGKAKEISFAFAAEEIQPQRGVGLKKEDLLFQKSIEKCFCNGEYRCGICEYKSL
jgi:hypothetical protein